MENKVMNEWMNEFIKLSVDSEKIFKMRWKFLYNLQIKNNFSSLSLCDAHKYVYFF